MLRISKLTDYATVILSYLASEEGSIFSATHLAKVLHLGVPTVSKLLKLLTEAKLVDSFRGPVGGYKLARDAKTITITEIISAIDGNISITECASKSNHCSRDRLCSIKENWQFINKLIYQTLEGLTLKDMTKPLSDKKNALKGITIAVQGAFHDNK